MRESLRENRKFYDSLDIFVEVTHHLPYLLFLVIPYLYDYITGYSIVVCLPIACVYFFLSSNCWLELKSRYINQIEPYLTNKTIYRLLTSYYDEDENELHRNNQSLFKMLHSVLGLNTAVLVSVVVGLNAVSLHCIIIKWFYEDILPRIFQFVQNDNLNYHSCINSTIFNGSFVDTSALFNSANRTTLVLLESLTNFIYFLTLLISAHGLVIDCSKFKTNQTADVRLADDEQQAVHDSDTARNQTSQADLYGCGNETKFFKISIFYTIFYCLLIVILYLTLSNFAYKLIIECETFFKGNSIELFFFGASVLLSSFNTIILNDFTRIRNKKCKINRSVPATRDEPSCTSELFSKYLNILNKLMVVTAVSIMFVILLNTFSKLRNECCLTFYESLFNTSEFNFLKHSVKQVCLMCMCIYLFTYSHVQFKYVIDNTYQMAVCLFVHETSVPETNVLESTDDLNEDIFVNSTTQIYQKTTTNSSSSNLFVKNAKKLLKCVILVVYMLIGTLAVIFLDKINLLYVWSMAFLALNLVMVSGSLLVNYFPYQVLMENLQETTSSGVLFRTSTGGNGHVRSLLECSKLIKQQQQPPKADAQSSASPVVDQTAPLEGDNDGEIIDNAFIEHKVALRQIALSNKSLSFGKDQPSMRSAYLAVLGYVVYCVSSFAFILLVEYLAHIVRNEREYYSKPIVVSVFIGFFVILKLAFSYVFLVKNAKETIYRQNLFYKTFSLPYLQLVVIFVNIFLVSKLNTLVVVRFFWLVLVILLVALVLLNRLVFKLNAKKRGDNLNHSMRFNNARLNIQHEVTDPDSDTYPESHVFTINTDGRTRNFEPLLDLNHKSNLAKMKIHGSLSSNINLVELD